MRVGGIQFLKNNATANNMVFYKATPSPHPNPQEQCGTWLFSPCLSDQLLLTGERLMFMLSALNKHVLSLSPRLKNEHDSTRFKLC